MLRRRSAWIGAVVVVLVAAGGGIGWWVTRPEFPSVPKCQEALADPAVANAARGALPEDWDLRDVRSQESQGFGSCQLLTSGSRLWFSWGHVFDGQFDLAKQGFCAHVPVRAEVGLGQEAFSCAPVVYRGAYRTDPDPVRVEAVFGVRTDAQDVLVDLVIAGRGDEARDRARCLGAALAELRHMRVSGHPCGSPAGRV